MDDAFEVIVDSNTNGLFRLFLTDDVFVEVGFDFLWEFELEISPFRGVFPFFLKDVVCLLDAIVSDVSGDAGDEYIDFFLGSSAEGAIDRGRTHRIYFRNYFRSSTSSIMPYSLASDAIIQ